MEFASLVDFLEAILHFVPRAISAALLVLLGGLGTRFLAATVAALARSANIPYSRLLASLVEYVLLAFLVIIAISLLGIDTTVLTTSFTIRLAALGLAIALSFGSGSQEAARNIIAGCYIRRHFSSRQELHFGRYQGRFQATSGMYTTLKVSDETGQTRLLSIPNTLFLRQIILGGPASPASEAAEAAGPQAGKPGSSPTSGTTPSASDAAHESEQRGSKHGETREESPKSENSGIMKSVTTWIQIAQQKRSSHNGWNVSRGGASRQRPFYRATAAREPHPRNYRSESRLH